MTDNKTIVDRAREIAAAAPGGSLERRAAGCVVVVAATTATVKAARAALDAVALDDVRQAAIALLDRLNGEPGPGTLRQ